MKLPLHSRTSRGNCWRLGMNKLFHFPHSIMDVNTCPDESVNKTRDVIDGQLQTNGWQLLFIYPLPFPSYNGKTITIIFTDLTWHTDKPKLWKAVKSLCSFVAKISLECKQIVYSHYCMLHMEATYWIFIHGRNWWGNTKKYADRNTQGLYHIYINPKCFKCSLIMMALTMIDKNMAEWYKTTHQYQINTRLSISKVLHK